MVPRAPVLACPPGVCPSGGGDEVGVAGTQEAVRVEKLPGDLAQVLGFDRC